MAARYSPEDEASGNDRKDAMIAIRDVTKIDWRLLGDLVLDSGAGRVSSATNEIARSS
jgi:hypothetical protein